MSVVKHKGYCAELVVSGFTTVQVYIYKQVSNLFGFGTEIKSQYWGKNLRKKDINNMHEAEVVDMLENEIENYIKKQEYLDKL